MNEVPQNCIGGFLSVSYVFNFPLPPLPLLILLLAQLSLGLLSLTTLIIVNPRLVLYSITVTYA